MSPAPSIGCAGFRFRRAQVQMSFSKFKEKEPGKRARGCGGLSGGARAYKIFYELLLFAVIFYAIIFLNYFREDVQ